MRFLRDFLRISFTRNPFRKKEKSQKTLEAERFPFNPLFGENRKKRKWWQPFSVLCVNRKPKEAKNKDFTDFSSKKGKFGFNDNPNHPFTKIKTNKSKWKKLQEWNWSINRNLNRLSLMFWALESSAFLNLCYSYLKP